MPDALIPVLKYIAGKAGEWLSKKATGKLVSREEVVAALREMGFDVLSDHFDSVYAHSLVVFAAEGKSETVMELFRDDEVIEAFRESWADREWKHLERKLRLAAERKYVDAELRARQIDIRAEADSFRELFGQFVSKARTPGQQDIAAILNELRAGIVGPPYSAELEKILRELEERARSRKASLTRGHLFCRLLQPRLQEIPSRHRARVSAMVAELDRRLQGVDAEAHEFEKSAGYDETLAAARASARSAGAPSVDVARVLSALLSQPGANVETVLRRHKLSPADLQAMLAKGSPRAF